MTAVLLASATAMADVQPLRALHYDPAVVGPLANVVAPPYDVIDAGQRAALIARSPFNVVAIDLPQADPATRTRTRPRASCSRPGSCRARSCATPQPALWAHTQDYTGPDGGARTRRGFFCRVRIEEYGAGRVRPHERTHPGPKEDRLRLTRATRANVSPIFSLYSDPEQAAWRRSRRPPSGPPWARGHRRRRHRPPPLARRATAARSPPCRPATRDAELLIADGHHRYETMHAYAEEVGGEGEHRYILMCLVALEDPGLTVFPTHRLVGGLDEARRRGARSRRSSATSTSPRCRSSRSRRRPGAARCSSATSTAATDARCG